MPAFNDVVRTLDELRAIVGQPGERTLLKEQRRLDAHTRAFIAHSPMLLMATAGSDGTCDVSPKGDAPGFVLTLDDQRLVIPDRPGNKRLDGMQNLLANPRIGLLFIVPGRQETLRVNGRASITLDPALLDRLAVDGKRPLVGIGVEVEQVFMHCAKAFLRSRIWQPEHWPAADVLPGMARVLFDQIRPPGQTVEDYERDIDEGNRTRLY
jgi:PPOX class probable FMN-dependent enzyme